MSNLKKIMLLLTIIVAIIIILLVCLIIRLKNRNEGYVVEDEGEDLYVVELNTNLQRVSSRNDYYTVQDCVKKYYLNRMSMFEVDYNNEGIDEETSPEEVKKISAETIYNLLDKEYLDEAQITENNVATKMKKINQSNINITDMYVSKRTERIEAYVVEGYLREKKGGNISNFKIIVKLDTLNRTFTILPQEYMSEKYQNIKEGDKIELKTQEQIEINKDNKYDYRNITDAVYIEYLLDTFQEEIIFNQELAYKKLDQAYSKAKFENINDFKEFIKNNVRKYIIAKLDKYQKTKEEEYTQYMLQDTKGNYYIFKETAPMKYTLILDTYTIDIPEFTEKYKNSNDQQKMILNLNKFMQSINDKDYKFAYNILAESFRAKNFSTLEAFKIYVEQNFFKENKFEYKEFNKEGETYYTYKINITDSSGEKANMITKTFVMLLEEGNEFKMSFNIQ